MWVPSTPTSQIWEQVHGIVLTGLPAAQRVRFGALKDVFGDVQLSDLPAVTSVVMNTNNVDVMGALSLTGAPSLTSLTGLHTIGRLTGDLSVTDNLTLPPAEVDDLAAAIEVHLGAVVNTGNGG